MTMHVLFESYTFYHLTDLFLNLCVSNCGLVQTLKSPLKMRYLCVLFLAAAGSLLLAHCLLSSVRLLSAVIGPCQPRSRTVKCVLVRAAVNCTPCHQTGLHQSQGLHQFLLWFPALLRLQSLVMLSFTARWLDYRWVYLSIKRLC